MARARSTRARRAHDLHSHVEGLDPARVGVVGHDFGAIDGLLLTGEVGLGGGGVRGGHYPVSRLVPP
ncbi:MAG TPA: hypothetical protein VE569_11485, partial [Acidimicrobiia bacterium]|nr:hypothetical protein [Acidimicrobiia bacterium]